MNNCSIGGLTSAPNYPIYSLIPVLIIWLSLTYYLMKHCGRGTAYPDGMEMQSVS